MYLLCNRNTYDKLINLAADMGDFGKNYGKKHLMSEELKSAKLFLVMVATITTTITFCYETD